MNPQSTDKITSNTIKDQLKIVYFSENNVGNIAFTGVGNSWLIHLTNGNGITKTANEDVAEASIYIKNFFFSQPRIFNAYFKFNHSARQTIRKSPLKNSFSSAFDTNPSAVQFYIKREFSSSVDDVTNAEAFFIVFSEEVKDR